MKNIFKYLFLFLATTVVVSCDEELDNTNPNTPPQITKGLALTSAEASMAVVVGGDLMNLGGFYAQYHTQAPSASQYESIDQYNITTEYGNRIWQQMYAGALNDLQYIIQESEEDGDTGSMLIAQTLTAYTYQLLVDLFDDVPYTNALQGELDITPVPTDGQEIYLDLIERLDAAIAAYEANPVNAEVYGSDVIFFRKAIDANASASVEEINEIAMENWIRFANTLKLRLYIRMAYTPQANPAAVTALLAEDRFLEEDATFDAFGTSINQRNPFYEVQIEYLGDVNNIASASLLNFYTENGDPRVEAVYRPNTTGAYTALPQGAGPEFTNLAQNYARPNISQQTPVFFMSAAESHFLQAEALIRYSGGAGAKEEYDAGVMASFETYATHFGLDDPGAAAALIGPGGAYEYQTGADVEATVRQVIIQKWAALAYVNNIEAWIETTRTKFPEIVDEGSVNYEEGNRIPSRISVLPGENVPSILFYPDVEVERNPNIIQRNSLTENVWWDQKLE